jgi:hypothetical protein
MLDKIKHLIKIAEEDNWDESEMENGFHELAHDFFCRDDEQRWEPGTSGPEVNSIPRLAKIVEPYVPYDNVPEFPQAPDGQLHEIGFIYDHDRDNRVLVAIEKLRAQEILLQEDDVEFKDMRVGEHLTGELRHRALQSRSASNIVAVAERKGTIKVFLREYDTRTVRVGDIEVCEDEWEVVEYAPFKNGWIALDDRFSRECIGIVLSQQYDKEGWKKQPATTKQISYLKGLGYGGCEKITKGQAGELIDRYKSIKLSQEQESVV